MILVAVRVCIRVYMCLPRQDRARSQHYVLFRLCVIHIRCVCACVHMSHIHSTEVLTTPPLADLKRFRLLDRARSQNDAQRRSRHRPACQNGSPL